MWDVIMSTTVKFLLIHLPWKTNELVLMPVQSSYPEQLLPETSFSTRYRDDLSDTDQFQLCFLPELVKILIWAQAREFSIKPYLGIFLYHARD